MSSINSSYSQFMHTYEAFRIPKGHEALNAPNAEAIKGENGDSILILTPEASKQLVKDRFSYIDKIQAEAEMAAQKSQAEGAKQYAENQQKVLSVFRSMSNGDNVPAGDEKKLMEFDPKLYQIAKTAQALAQQMKKGEIENKKSAWDEKEEAEKKERLDEINKESNELAASMGEKSRKFNEAQESMVVEVDAGKVDLNAIKGFFKYTDNIGGAFFDMSV